jgi:hypothetical protein
VDYSTTATALVTAWDMAVVGAVTGWDMVAMAVA